MSQINYYCTVDGVDLNTVTGLTIISTDPYKPPKRNLSILNIARSNKSKNASAFYNKRQITVTVAISRATRGLLETSIDSLMTLVQGLEKTVQLQQSNGYRNYIATLTDTNVNIDGGSFIQMSLIFECVDRFGYDTASTLLVSWASVTGNYRTDSMTIGGSADWQLPVIQFTYSALSGSGSQPVIVGNSANGQQVTISRVWTANDLVEIDAYNRTVKVNGVEVAFTGAFPEFAPGTGYIYYTDQFTSRTYSGSVRYTKRWV